MLKLHLKTQFPSKTAHSTSCQKESISNSEWAVGKLFQSSICTDVYMISIHKGVSPNLSFGKEYAGNIHRVLD